MPYADKEKEKQLQHRLYLERKELLIKAKLAAGIPLDKRLKSSINPKIITKAKSYGHDDSRWFVNICKIKSIPMSVVEKQEALDALVELLCYLKKHCEVKT